MTGIPLTKLGLSDDAPVAMLKLGDGLPLIPLDAIKDVDWQRRWAVAQSKRDTAGGQSNTIKTLVNEAMQLLGPDLLIRAAQKNPQQWGVGVREEHGAKFKSLSEQAQAFADEEKKREGVKAEAGRRRVRVVGE